MLDTYALESIMIYAAERAETMDTYTLPTLTLENGRTLRNVPIAYHTWGTLNEAGTNAVFVCHALTGTPDVADWWGGLMGPGKALDIERYFVVSANVLGSPYGSASPLTVDPDTGNPYGNTFPMVTIRDTVAAHKHLLDSLGVRQVFMAIGGSMGGMQVLEWALLGDFVQHVVPIAVGAYHSAWCIGWSDAQRSAIFADARWQGGVYEPGAGPDAGLAAARMMAMISYRTRTVFDERFGRDKMPLNGHHERTGDKSSPYSVESYLRYQGQKLVDRFDANCYVRLTEQMDTHDVGRGRGAVDEALLRIKQPTLVIGINTDILYPLEEQRELAAGIPNSRLFVLDTPHGHDAFLIELDALNEAIEAWLSSLHCEAPISS